MGTPRASLIVRCYNEEAHIGKLLYGLQAQADVDFETIVVDSGSTDRTVEISRSYGAKLVFINPEDFTFGRALNLGCGQARGEFLVFASAHVYPTHQHWLKTLLDPFDNSRIGAVYGKQRGGDNSQFSEHRIFEQWFPEKDIPVQDTPFCNNANCAVRRALWQEVRYDEEITGLEDLKWAKEIVSLGYRVAYAADAEIIHVHDETPRTIMNRYRREAIALKQTYPEQRMNFVSFVNLLTRNVLADYAHAARSGQLLGAITEIPTFRLMQFWGAYLGFRQSGTVPQKLKQTFYYPALNNSGPPRHVLADGRHPPIEYPHPMQEHHQARL